MLIRRYKFSKVHHSFCGEFARNLVISLAATKPLLWPLGQYFSAQHGLPRQFVPSDFHAAGIVDFSVPAFRR